MDDNKYAIFQAWFNRKWAEWDARNERRSTQYELAAHLDITRSAVAQYTSGRQVPDNGNLLSISKKFGDEVYEILGVDKPEPKIPPAFEQLLEEIERSIRAAGVPPSSADGLKIANSILSEYMRKESL